MSTAQGAGHSGEHGVVLLEADAEAGRAYLSDLAWALDYAAENRRRMMEIMACSLKRIAGIRALPETAFDCHRNFSRREEHDGRALWVHRKAPSRPGVTNQESFPAP